MNITEAQLPAVTALGAWRCDRSAYDPSAIIRTVEADGRLYTLHNLMGPGWPMSIRDDSPRHIGMADWNDMAGVRRAIDAHNARQA